MAVSGSFASQADLHGCGHASLSIYQPTP